MWWDPEQEPEMQAVASAVPDGWHAIIALARPDPSGGVDIRLGGVRITRGTALVLLRRVLEDLERQQ